MKTILLSFTPEPFYLPIKEGLKRFEYRSRFLDEECIAYLYLSSPVQKVVAKLTLGKRIDILPWREKYKEDTQAIERLENFIEEGKQYGNPILEYTELVPISLKEIRETFDNFHPPRSYYILNHQEELMKFCEDMTTSGVHLVNEIREIDSNEVCIY